MNPEQANGGIITVSAPAPTPNTILATDTHIGKLNRRELSQISQTVVSGIFIHNEGDVLHMLGAEPPRHD